MRMSSGWLFLVTIIGCIPVMPHPTRVDAALRLGTNMSVSFARDSQENIEAVHSVGIPSVDLELALGLRDTSSANAPGLRLSGSAGLSGYGGALYAEGPRQWIGDVDAGIGVAVHHGSFDVLMPYVQFGRGSTSTSSWFVRNGVAWVAPPDSARWRALWLPTVGFFWSGDGGREGSVHLTGIVGGSQPRVERYCLLFKCSSYSNSYSRTYLILGATFSVPMVRPDYPYPRGSRNR